MAVAACSTSNEADIKSTVDYVSSKFIPDRREGVAQIDFVLHGNNVILKGETDCAALADELVAEFAAGGYTVTDSITVLPDASVENKYGIVTLSVMNMRTAPRHSAEMASQSLMGTPVKILKSSGAWILVQTPDRYVAWTEKISVSAVDSAGMEKWLAAEKVICSATSGWIYEDVDETKVICDFVAGCIIENSGIKGRHLNVTLPDGRSGYIRTDAVEDYSVWKNKPEPGGDDIIKTAVTLSGIPYLWGGTSPKAADCSGFVQNVYFRNGIILSRDASLQALHGEDIDISVSFDGLQKGDLLFFGTMHDSVPRVTHVAIYKGNGEYIHSSGMVRVNSLDSERTNFNNTRRSSLLLAKRIIGNVSTEGITAVKNHRLY